jgi:protease PrsW
MAGSTQVFDPRAVLEGREPGRTRIGLIIGIVAAAACVLLALGAYLLESIAAGRSAAPFFIALPLALVPVPLLVAGVLFVDRLEPEPRADLTFTFLWGAGVAALFALIINTAGLDYITQPELGASTGQYVSATLGAPVVEETLKGLVLLWLVSRRRPEFDGPTDAITYAALVGLGFAMTENVGYYINALVTPVYGGAQLLGDTFVLRGVLSPLLHPIFTSMTALGAAYAASHRRATWALPLGWLAAVLLHATWNGLSVLGSGGTAAGYGIMMCVLAGLIVVLVKDRHRIVALITHVLPAYQPTGLVTADDISMLATLRARRRARNWARATGGLAAAAAMGDYQLAATELALLHQKATRGVVTPQEFHDRQNALLGLMHVARDAFQRRHAEPPHAPWAPPGTSGFTHGTPSRTQLPPVPEPVGPVSHRRRLTDLSGRTSAGGRDRRAGCRIGRGHILAHPHRQQQPQHEDPQHHRGDHVHPDQPGRQVGEVLDVAHDALHDQPAAHDQRQPVYRPRRRAEPQPDDQSHHQRAHEPADIGVQLRHALKRQVVPGRRRVPGQRAGPGHHRAGREHHRDRAGQQPGHHPQVGAHQPPGRAVALVHPHVQVHRRGDDRR